MQSFYLELRHDAGGPNDGAPITARQLESLVRLAEARARVDLRDTVTREDAEVSFVQCLLLCRPYYLLCVDVYADCDLSALLCTPWNTTSTQYCGWNGIVRWKGIVSRISVSNNLTSRFSLLAWELLRSLYPTYVVCAIANCSPLCLSFFRRM